MNALYIGVMSGTSLDGVDVVLCEISDTVCTLHASYEHPFPKTLKASVLDALSSACSLHDIGTLNHRLGQLFAEAVTALIHRAAVNPEAIRAIGLHGQTLWHEPKGTFPFTMQLGDGAVVAVKTGIDVVCDFRAKDIALGGQGAPFAPAFHRFLFQNMPASTCILNIGGMANITVLNDPLLGYDTGPGNVLMDLWISQHHNIAYDKEGAWAQSGNVNKTLLKRCLQTPYFAASAPKSTGRECFNATWLNGLLQQSSIAPEDVQATLLELSVQTIAQELNKHHCKKLLVCGGGVRNHFFMQRLGDVLQGVHISPTDAYGVSSDFMEAMAFAWLAHKRINNEAVALKEVTGARHNTVLGAVYAGR